MKATEARTYADPEVLVSTSWVATNLENPAVRIIESNEDTLLYATGHIPGAVHVDWTHDLNDPIRRDYLHRSGFESLMSRIGATPETMVVFYGDKNNWWACYAFWVFQLFGHTRAKVMDGGRLKWQKEQRTLTRDVRQHPITQYKASERNDSINRAFRDEVLKHLESKLPLVDVRSLPEYSGERLHMPDYPNEGALRGGHIPGAKHIPWAKAINPETGAFLSADELHKIYEEDNGLNQNDPVIAYCRIGERSSHTWFVLKYLLGFKNVRNYDGSWTEWGKSGQCAHRKVTKAFAPRLFVQCREGVRGPLSRLSFFPTEVDETVQEYPESLTSFLETLSFFAEESERASMLISYADQFKEVPAEIAQRPFAKEHQVPFCESEAYVWAVPNPDGTLRFYFAVENPSGVSAKALAVILDKTLSGAP